MTGSGRRRAAKRSGVGPVRALVLLAVAGLVAVAAWYVLVRMAISFGHAGLGGRGAGWAFMGLATLGAAACLLLLFTLVARALGTFGLLARYRPRRSRGRRASR